MIEIVREWASDPEPTYECATCIDERLVRALGNLLVCPNCDLVYVHRDNVNKWLGDRAPVLVIEEPGEAA